MSRFRNLLPNVSQSTDDPAFLKNPFDFYRECRALGDFVFWEDYQLPFAVTQQAVHKVLRHPHLGRATPDGELSSPDAKLSSFYALERNSFLELEPPDHSRLRKIAMRGFARDRLAKLIMAASQIADRLIDDFPPEPFDLIAAYANPLPAQVITQFLGFDIKDAAMLQSWSNDMVAMYQANRTEETERKAEAAASNFSAFILKETRQRPAIDEPSFIGELIQARNSGQISEDEMISTAILLLNAGHEATVLSIGNAIALLIDHPGRADMLAPESIEDTVEETLRFYPPLHIFKRHVYKDDSFLDVSFQAGDEIACLLGAACRDDSVWPDGDKFDPFRLRRTHTAFGSGIHACIGAPMTRLEMQVALPALFSRCPTLRLVEPLQFTDRYHFFGQKRLMVDLG